MEEKEIHYADEVNGALTTIKTSWVDDITDTIFDVLFDPLAVNPKEQLRTLLKNKVEGVITAAADLEKKYWTVKPHIDAAFVNQFIRYNKQYGGPTLGVELDKLTEELKKLGVRK